MLITLHDEFYLHTAPLRRPLHSELHQFQAIFNMSCYINDYACVFISESHVAEVDGGEKADREAGGKVSRTNMDLVFYT